MPRRRFAARLLLLAAALCLAAPARAQFRVLTKVTVMKYLTTYPNATAPANYFRLFVEGLTVGEVVRAESGGLRRTPIGGGFYAFQEPLEVAALQPFQPGNPNKRDGFFDFRVKNAQDPLGQLFRPGDEATFVVTVRGQDTRRFQTPRAWWRTGDGGAGVNTTLATLKLNGGKANFDPDFTLFNDLDPADYGGGSDAPFVVRNLRFIDNMTPADFDALQLRPIYDEGAQSGLPSVNLSSSLATNPQYSESSHTYLEPFAEPDPGNYVGAYGQVVDPSTGAVLSAFVYGARAAVVPEPATLALVGAGVLVLAAASRRAVLREHEHE